MIVGDMFQNPITRDINTEIQVDEDKEEEIIKELSEYVVTKELQENFLDFFEIYNKSLDKAPRKEGVLISGYYGSGKSHFLKILALLLSNQKIHKKYAIDYFKEGQKVSDDNLISLMENSTKLETEVILFNIGLKSSQNENERESLLLTFLKVFNEHLGYCVEIPFIADFERKLYLKGKYQEFKDEFKKINGSLWVDVRDDYFFNEEDVFQTLVKIGFKDSIESAEKYLEGLDDTFDISPEKFVGMVKDYCESFDKEYRLIFLVDEVGQFIAENGGLSDLQNFTENLKKELEGRAWLVITTQEEHNLRNIKDRFYLLSLSSSDADEVIKKRLLLKKYEYEKILQSDYNAYESHIKTILTFNDQDRDIYKDAKDYSSVYPFVPYQFDLSKKILVAIRENEASGTHINETERHMLELFQYSAQKIKDDENGVLVSCNNFYEPLAKYLDHDNKYIINDAKNKLNEFDVEILKLLYLIKDVEEIYSDIDNLTTFMISSIDEDRLELKKKVEQSLKNLVDEFLVHKIDNEYVFLTNEQQEANKEIKKIHIEKKAVMKRVANKIFKEIIKNDNYSINDHLFKYNKYIDNILIGKETEDIGIKVITPYNDSININDLKSIDDKSQEENNIFALKKMSMDHDVVIIYLNEEKLFKDVYESMQIEKYIDQPSKNEKIKKIKLDKQEELNLLKDSINSSLYNSLKKADIYVKESLVNIPEKNPNDRITDSLKFLINEVFGKLSYINKLHDLTDIEEILQLKETDNNSSSNQDEFNALNDLNKHIMEQSENHVKISLKDVITKYNKKPYGYDEIDIEWLVANLFSYKKIILKYQNEELYLRRNEVSNIVDYLTNKDYREKIIIEKKKEISNDKIIKARDVLYEISGKNCKIDSEEVRDKLQEEFENKVSSIEKTLEKYKNNEIYPGQNDLKDAKPLFVQGTVKDTYNFFEYVYNKKDGLISASENIEPILDFMNSENKQKKIFDDSIKIIQKYDNNENYINDEDIDKSILKIREIINLDKPYDSIQKLGKINKAFNDKYKNIIKNEKNLVLDFVDKQYNETKELLSKYCPDKLDESSEKFKRLKERLKKATDLSAIDQFKNESERIKNNFTEDLEKKQVMNSENKKHINNNSELSDEYKPLHFKDLMSKEHIKINNEQELEDFIKNIREKLASELNNNQVIDIEKN